MRILRACISTRPVPSSDVLFHYVVVRRDLPIGLLAAMLVHAAGESSPGNLPEDTHAVVLAVPGEAELEALSVRLRAAGVDVRRIVEPDPPWSGALMALGVRPGPRGDLRRVLSDVPLFRGCSST